MIEPMLGKDDYGKDLSVYYWEKKFRGARIVAFVHGTNVHLQARSGSNKTETFPELRLETKKAAILDGEVVSSTESFSNLQRRINLLYSIETAAQELPCEYRVFDILEYDGKNCEEEPLYKRKEILADILVPTNNVDLVEFTEDGFTIWQKALKENWEGLMGKSKYGVYQQGKRKWFKLKLFKSDTFYAVGYTPGEGKREKTFGSLVLVNMDMVYVGEVGTGFDDAEVEELFRDMVAEESPFTRDPINFTPVKPFLVRVQYGEYSNDGILVSTSFKERL